MATMKTVCRTLFYQYLLLFVGCALGFIFNAEYVGWKSLLVQQSAEHIFFPTRYDEKIEQALIQIGRMRLNVLCNQHPFDDSNIEIVRDFIWGEEVYHALYRHTAGDQPAELFEFKTRIYWKPWEYYFEFHPSTGADFDTITREAPKPPAAEKRHKDHHSQHRDPAGRPIPGPVQIPEHPSSKPWWER